MTVVALELPLKEKLYSLINRLQLELTFERHGFGLHKSTYLWILSVINMAELHDPWLVESTDVKLWIWVKVYTESQL